MRMYAVDVQTTAVFVVKRLIVDTLQGGSECRMKSGKELCTVYKHNTTLQKTSWRKLRVQ